MTTAVDSTTAGSVLGPATAPASSSTALQGLDRDVFLQLLVAQMRYQNPLKPQDSNEFLNQAAQYAAVEQLEAVAQGQAELKSLQVTMISTQLVGQQVTAISPLTGEPVTGIVEAVRYGGAEPVLVVDGQEIPLGYVTTVAPPPSDLEPEPDPVPDPTADATPDPTADAAPATDGSSPDTGGPAVTVS